MKKKYKKPQVVEVKLTIPNPILGECDLGTVPELYNCNITGGCSFP
jgi:hypothetical protein